MLRSINCGMICLLLAGAAAAEEAPIFRWQKTINVEAKSAAVLTAAPLDSDIYASTREGFPDLRLLDADGQLVPFLIRPQIKQREVVDRSAWGASNIELTPSDAGLEIKLSLQADDPQPSGLSVITPLKSFDQRVAVYGTEPGQPERQLVQDALIFDYSQFMSVRRSDIRLPDNKCRSFRLTLQALTANQESELLQITRNLTDGGKTEANRSEQMTVQRRAFRIERIDFWRETKRLEEKSKVEHDYPVAKLAMTEDAEKHETTLTLTTRREPLTGFKIATGDANFRRTVQVLVPQEKGVRTEWREIASGTISKFAIGDFSESKLTLHFPEQRHETYRIVLKNGDSRPLNIESVSGLGHVYEAVSLRNDKNATTVSFGSDLAKAPQFDLAAIQLALDRSTEIAASTLGPQTEATPAARMPLNLQAMLNNPVLLGGLVCVLIAVLAVCLMKAGKRIAELPEDSSEGTPQ